MYEKNEQNRCQFWGLSHMHVRPVSEDQFNESEAVWPDLEQFRQFGVILNKGFGIFVRV